MASLKRRWIDSYAFLQAVASRPSSPRLTVMDLGHAAWRLALIAMNPRRHVAVLEHLRLDEVAPIRARQPHLPFKYLRRNYLAANLDRAERAATLSRHYADMARRLRPGVLQAVAGEGVRLWQTAGAATADHEVRLILAHPVDNEGEFALAYRFGDTVVGVLSFSLAPAALFALSGEAVPLVSRIQTSNDGAMLRAAAKDRHDLAPRFVLAAVLQGMAIGLGCRAIVAVSRCNQVAFRTDREAVSPESYDGFYAALSGRPGRPGFFVMDVPFVEKDLALVAAAHRRRAKRKRAARRAIADEAEAATEALLRCDRARSMPTVAAALALS